MYLGILAIHFCIHRQMIQQRNCFIASYSLLYQFYTMIVFTSLSRQLKDYLCLLPWKTGNIIRSPVTKATNDYHALDFANWTVLDCCFYYFFFWGGDTFCNLAFKILYQVSFTCSGIQIITEMIFIINYKFTLWKEILKQWW